MKLCFSYFCNPLVKIGGHWRKVILPPSNPRSPKRFELYPVPPPPSLSVCLSFYVCEKKTILEHVRQEPQCQKGEVQCCCKDNRQLVSTTLSFWYNRKMFYQKLLLLNEKLKVVSHCMSGYVHLNLLVASQCKTMASNVPMIEQTAVAAALNGFLAVGYVWHFED